MKSKLKNENRETRYEDEINLLNLLNFLIRNLKLISITTVIFFITACIYGLLSKRVWEGKFQIVLEKDKENSPLNKILGNSSNNTLFEQFNQLDGGGISLKTEVGILSSPSVLMPIYDYINQSKKKNNQSFNPTPFEKWKEQKLVIEFIPATTILDISYKDSDKDLILPVLSKISNTYQDYSRRRTKRSITLSKNYLTEQIKKYKDKSIKSLRESQEFAFDQDLTILDSKNLDLNNDGKLDQFEQFTNNESNILLEKIRSQSLNNIRNIDNQIEQLKLIKDSSNQLAYIGNNLIFLKKDKIFKKINEIEEELFIARSKYTEKDRTVTQLVKARQVSLKILKERAIGNLQALRTIEKAKMDSATRPKDIVLKYKDLVRASARDQNTLIQLENQLRFVNLEEARYKDPWELITKPTLYDSPIAPRRKFIAIFGGILGLLTGVFLSFIKDKKDYFLNLN